MNNPLSNPPSAGEEPLEQKPMTSSGQSEEIRWEVVAQTSGITPAHIYAGHLEAEGIPARVWQEGAGQALGLTVGLLGTGYVAVPQAYFAQAQAILAESDSGLLEEEE